MTCGIGHDDIERFRDLIEKRLGLNFDAGKSEFLADILSRRLHPGGDDGIRYLQRLERHNSQSEWQALAQLLTVPETYFFRHFDQFRAFTEVALCELAQGTGRPLSILSAGCASGEEAYSLAVMVREGGAHATRAVSILGVDLNPAMIAKAAAGRYSAWALRETSPAARTKWFRTSGRDHVLDDAVRGMVRFEVRNLAEDDQDFWRPAAYDIIFCRNMMMYFSARCAQTLVSRFAQSLRAGGYLFLGHAETLRGISHDFHLCHTHDTFYYQRRHDGDLGTELPSPSVGAHALPSPLAAVLERDDSWIAAIQSSAARIESLVEPPASTPATSPAGSNPAWNLGHAFDMLRTEHFAEALCAVRRLPAEAAQDPDALLLTAVLCTHSGDLDEAERVCRRLLDLDELNAGAHYVLGLCREGAGDSDAAVGHCQTAAYLDPVFAMPRLHLGLLARRANDQAAARRELVQALTLLQNEESSRLLLFGGGFGREALVTLCRAELTACGGRL